MAIFLELYTPDSTASEEAVDLELRRLADGFEYPGKTPNWNFRPADDLKGNTPCYQVLLPSAF